MKGTGLKGKGGRRVRKWVLLTLLVLLVAVVAACTAYLATYSPADATAIAALAPDSEDGVQVMRQAGMIVFRPAERIAATGFILYPGGKVGHEAYAPLLREIARRGHLAVVVEVPFRLAIFETDAAKRAMAAVPGIQRWVLGGHSLGGVAASLQAKAQRKPVDASGSRTERTDAGPTEKAAVAGLVLLASYPTGDMSDLDLPVLSLRGTKDGLVTPEKWAQYNPYLPAGAQLVELPGGNHAQFGSYGPQKGDGLADVTAQAQWDWTAGLVSEFLLKLDK